MGEESFESMAEEVGLPAEEYADVTAMLGAFRSAADDLPTPTPRPELAAMLTIAPVRRLARRRRIATAAGATALALGSLGGAAAADVLPEPVRGLVVPFSDFPGGPPPVSPGAPPASDVEPTQDPAEPRVTPPSTDFFGVVPEAVPPTDRPSPAEPTDDLPGERDASGVAPETPPSDSPPQPAPTASEESGSQSSENSPRRDDGAPQDGDAGSGDRATGPRQPLPDDTEGEQERSAESR